MKLVFKNFLDPTIYIIVMCVSLYTLMQKKYSSSVTFVAELFMLVSGNYFV